MEPAIFIISWKGMHARAAGIARELAAAGRHCHVVFSDPDPEFNLQCPGSATRLDDSSFWAAKFAACLAACGDGPMLVIHADTECRDWPALAARCRDVMAARPEIGVWAPRIEGAFFDIGNAAIKAPREDGLVTMANTDGIVFALGRPEVARMRQVDYSRNTYGWGIAWLFCSAAYAAGRIAVADRQADVTHLPGRGYDPGDALKLALRFLLRELRPTERIQFELLSRYIGRIF